jgi:hypothetical protein
MKNILLAACLSTTIIQGMNSLDIKKTDDFFSVICNKTQLTIHKGLQFDSEIPIDITVIGKVQQDFLQGKNSKKSYRVGTIQYSDNRTIYERRKSVDSDSEDDSVCLYSPVSRKITFNPREHTVQKVITVTEPRLISKYLDNASRSKVIAYPTEQLQGDKYVFVEKHEKEAFTASKQDLIECYKKSLTEGLQQLGEKPNKSISLSTFSSDAGFNIGMSVGCALMAIDEFTQNHPGAYEHIHLFIKKRPAFERCKELILICDVKEREQDKDKK